MLGLHLPAWSEPPLLLPRIRQQRGALVQMLLRISGMRNVILSKHDETPSCPNATLFSNNGQAATKIHEILECIKIGVKKLRAF
jgi:hypothetical protein